MPKRRFHFLMLCVSVLLLQAHVHAGDKRMTQLRDEVREQMLDHLDTWFPRCIDLEHGGFHASFAHDWTKLPDKEKLLTFQSRMTWVAAMAAQQLPDQRDRFLPIVEHGVAMLTDKLVDKQHGGLLWNIPIHDEDAAKLNPWWRSHKHAYAMSFALYALAKSYEVTGDEAILDFAKQQFHWFDQHAHDTVNGGYHEALTADGKPVTIPADIALNPKWDHIGTLRGYKSMNTHIHLLESFGALHHVWKDPTLEARFKELFAIVCEKIYVAPGCLNQVFTASWQPIPTGDSFGHDVETAYLLVESAELLGIPQDTRTWQIARNLVDHALAFGFDATSGGFYDEGAAHKPAYHKTKYWWTQAEALNALSIMDKQFGKQTPHYRDAMLKHWTYIKNHQLDSDFGGWHGVILPDNTVPTPPGKKGHNWKGAYHTFRALVLTSQRLNE